MTRGRHGWAGVALLLRGALRRTAGSLALTWSATTLTLLMAFTVLGLSASINPRPGEVDARLLGPYQLRVDSEWPPAVAGVSNWPSRGVRVLELDTTVTKVLGPSSGRSGAGEADVVSVTWGEVPPTLLEAGSVLAAGGWPTRAGEAAVSRTSASTLGVTAGSQISIGGLSMRVSAVYVPHADHTERSAVVVGSPRGLKNEQIAVVSYIEAPEDVAAQIKANLAMAGVAFVGTRPGNDAAAALNALNVGPIGSGLILAACIVAILTFVLGNKRLLSDLTRVRRIGGAGRQTGMAAGILCLATGALAVLTSWAGALALLHLARPPLEAAMSTDWFGVRIPLGDVFVAAALLVLVFPATTTLVVASRGRAAGRELRGIMGRPRVAVSVLVSLLVLVILVGAVSGQSGVAFIGVLPLALLLLCLWFVLLRSLAANGGRAGALSLVGQTMIRRADIATAGAAVLAVFILTVATFAWSMVAVSYAQLSGRAATATPHVREAPSDRAAVYVGDDRLSQRALTQAGRSAGADVVPWWTLTVPAPSGSDRVPVLPASAGTCMTGSQTAERSPEDCALALRGVGMTTAGGVETILGRHLTAAERQQFEAGHALTVWKDFATVDGLDLVAQNQLVASGSPPAPGSFVHLPQVSYSAPAAGHEAARSVPAIFVRITAAAQNATSPGGAIFVWPHEPSGEQVSDLQRRLMLQAELPKGKFLVTPADDDTPLQIVLVANIGWVLMPVVVVALLVGAWLARAQLRRDAAVVRAFGGSGWRIRAWFAGLGALSASAAVAVTWLCAAIGVQYFLAVEGLPSTLAGWRLLLPMLLAPLLAGAVGAFVAPAGSRHLVRQLAVD